MKIASWKHGRKSFKNQDPARLATVAFSHGVSKNQTVKLLQFFITFQIHVMYNNVVNITNADNQKYTVKLEFSTFLDVLSVLPLFELTWYKNRQLIIYFPSQIVVTRVKRYLVVAPTQFLHPRDHSSTWPDGGLEIRVDFHISWRFHVGSASTLRGCRRSSRWVHEHQVVRGFIPQWRSRRGFFQSQGR